MALRQLQISHDPVEDRLLIRVATQSNEEIRIHLTRRFLRQLWPGLSAIQTARPSVAFQEENKVEAPASPSFSEPYRNEDPVFPLGSQAFLASEAHLEPQTDGGCRITLGEAKGRSYTLNLTADLYDAFCAMLRAGSEQAEWQLSGEADSSVTHPSGQTAPKPASHLH